MPKFKKSTDAPRVSTAAPRLHHYVARPVGGTVTGRTPYPKSCDASRAAANDAHLMRANMQVVAVYTDGHERIAREVKP